MSPHGHETALRGPIELFHALIAAAATALSVENTQRSCARHSIGPTLSISRSSPSLPHTGHKHRCRTSLVFIIDLRWGFSPPRIVHSSVYLPMAIHEALREVAFRERLKIHDIILEGVEMVLRNRGRRE